MTHGSRTKVAIIGSGKRLFGDGTAPLTWRLTASSVTSTGMLMCSYVRAGDLVTGEYALEDELR